MTHPEDTQAKHDREADAAATIEMELDCACEASSGSYMEPSGVSSWSQKDNVIEFVVRESGRKFRMVVEEVVE